VVEYVQTGRGFSLTSGSRPGGSLGRGPGAGAGTPVGVKCWGVKRVWDRVAEGVNGGRMRCGSLDRRASPTSA
jgi:hypothetical protein